VLVYIRRDRKKLNNGNKRTYISFAHNVWESVPGKDKRPRPIVFANLGAEEDLDMGLVKGMRDALDRYIKKRFGEDALKEEVGDDTPEKKDEDTASVVKKAAAELAPKIRPLRFLLTVEYGLRTIVEPLWERLGLKKAFEEFASYHRIEFDFERIIFGMVLNRLIDPKSKHACNDWLKEHAYFPEAQEWHVQHFYRALDILDKHAEELNQILMRAVSERMSDSELELLLLDTTSTYFASDLDDEEHAAVESDWAAFDRGERREPLTPRPQVVNDPRMRMRGHSKDHRPDKPQVVIATLATADGRILRHKTYPGNTNDQSITVDMLKDAVKPQEGVRKVAVFDAGMGGAPNLKALNELEDPPDWISAVPLRKSKFGREQVLGLVGRYRKHPTKANFTYRAVQVSADKSPSGRAEMWIATRNKVEAERKKRRIDKHLERIKTVLAKDNRAEGHGKEVCDLLSHRSLKRYIKKSKDGKWLEINHSKVREEKRLAGIHLLRTTLTGYPPEVVLMAYESLLKVEENFKLLKGPIRLRPMHHRLDRRIRAHVSICVLALLILRELELRTGLNHAKLVKLFGPVRATLVQDGNIRYWQRSEWSVEALKILQTLDIKPGPITWGAERTETEKEAHIAP